GEIVIDMESGEIRHVPPEGGEAMSAEPAARPARSRRTAPRAASPEPSEDLLQEIVGRNIANAHVGTLRSPAEGQSGPVEVTVFFGARSGRIIGISSGHQASGATPTHTIAEHLLNNGSVPRRRAFHGTLAADGRSIVLEVPAEGERGAGRLHLDLQSGEIRFEADAAEPPSGPLGMTEQEIDSVVEALESDSGGSHPE
ncbi:MAG TPA: hypothetical protein VJR29_04955, partial [bacterium]|nr:hypothetical protein [bacterium]